ncbi:AbrB/MazE/SpoVT family DNA-binding domain-containing protein [Salarchaeum sp. JOR-1]|uniref:AbrB/MazE/SpoVT family DNA-binding domain-containing protein n=1 Tax=Salarchaeum sp. JOR-1 TaxID=2599399 RepID=UPI001198B0D6|nr:AbrB/MazE/SpoVT family DNA-binding domain-containing protein [Salarchaeum sp. JOR-1]QDX41074.1 phosphate uptake regulator PhoU [Salarchaeum sp. JOR-1]
MESRKVQSVGGGTLTVSLPREWADATGVSAGDSVDLHAHLDGVLVLQQGASEDDDTSHVTVRAVGEDRIGTVVRAAYTAGYRSIALDAPGGVTTGQRRALDRAVRGLPGLNVVEEGGDEVRLRYVLDPAEVSVPQSVRQLAFVARSVGRDAADALADGREVAFDDQASQASRLRAMVDRHFSRALSRLDEVDALGLTRPRLAALRTAAHELRAATGDAARLASVAGDVDAESEFADEVAALAGTAREAVDGATRSVLGDAGVDGAHDALTAVRGLRDSLDDLDRRLFEASDADYRLVRAADAVRAMAGRAERIATVGVQRGLRNGAYVAAEDGPETPQ